MSESNRTGRTVVLADPRWNGHHPTYFVEFTASLWRLGHRVIGLCRKPEELRELASDVCEDLELEFDEVLQVGLLDDPDRAYLRPGHDHDPIGTVVRWRCLRKEIDRAEGVSGWATDFNSPDKAFDVIYAAYEEFEGSSNALTKGAVFERPLVATRGECVGGRVEEFGLGLTIAQGSVTEGEEAIRRVLQGVDWEDRPLALRFADYHRRHDRNRLDEVFRKILAKS